MTHFRTFFKLFPVSLGALILIVAMTGSAAAETDLYLGITFHPFTLDGGNGTCVPWTDSHVGQTRNCDPVNLIFPDRTWVEVRDLLLSDGWTTSGFGSGQWLHYDGASTYRENEQLFKSDGSSKRYHIRLWQAPGGTLVTLAAVHHESGILVHTIDMAWEQVETQVGDQLCAPNCEQTGLLAKQIQIQGGDQEWRSWANNGSATIIPAPTSPDMPPTVSIINPSGANLVSGLVAVQIEASDGEDPAGTLDVEWNINGGAWQATTYNSGNGYYEASWDSTTVANGAHTLNARATDGASNVTGANDTITVDNNNDPPQASFTFTCTDLSCDFDASGSSDSDGNIVNHVWDFGEGNGGNGENANHIYGAAGTYNVWLTVTDNDGATGSQNQNVIVNDVTPSTMHVGDLNGIGLNVKKNWQAQVSITVHGAGEGLVAGATVDGSWSGDTSGTSSCTTDNGGACTLLSATMPKKGTDKAIFSVTTITHTSLDYNGGANHDPQGNSSGTVIQVNKDGTIQDPGVQPNQPPEASFTYSCNDATLTCDFDASGSSDPDGGVVAYDWDFTEGAPGSGLTPSHAFSTAGVHTVILTVTDNGGEIAQDQQNVSVGQPAGNPTLAASGYKVKGVQHTDLVWSDVASPNVDIFRNGSYIATISSGASPYTDNIGQKGGGSYLYQVCEAGTANCSNEAMVDF